MNYTMYFQQLQYDKNYESKIHEGFRKKSFLDNELFVARHNQKYEKGLVSFKLGTNKFSDMVRVILVTIHHCPLEK